MVENGLKMHILLSLVEIFENRDQNYCLHVDTKTNENRGVQKQ